VAQIIFYLLDVGTANALVLYNATLVNGNRMNINNFKCRLVMNFTGERISPVLVPSIRAVHDLQRTNSRHFCVWCSLSNRKKRTRYICGNPECQLPLCSVGSGCAAEDCFAICHSTEARREVAMMRRAAMISRTTLANQ
jgi:hypothetical protein